MTKARKAFYLNAESKGYYSGYSGIEMKEIEYGIDDYVIFVAGVWTEKKSVHRAKIYYTDSSIYFRYNGAKIPFDEIISV